MNQNLKDFLFFGAMILLALLLFGSGCGTVHRILHPFSPPAVATEQTSLPAAVQSATGLVPAPAPSGLHLFTPAPAPAQAPVPVKLASGQTVLMVPAAAMPAPATPVKSALSKLLVLVWIVGLLVHRGRSGA